jgi:hypothetical protein
MSVDGRNWNAFVILDAGGNAMRWARRAFHEDKYSYEQIVQRAQSAPDRFPISCSRFGGTYPFGNHYCLRSG